MILTIINKKKQKKKEKGYMVVPMDGSIVRTPEGSQLHYPLGTEVWHEVGEILEVRSVCVVVNSI
jgi:hypothetical protein